MLIHAHCHDNKIKIFIHCQNILAWWRNNALWISLHCMWSCGTLWGPQVGDAENRSLARIFPLLPLYGSFQGQLKKKHRKWQKYAYYETNKGLTEKCAAQPCRTHRVQQPQACANWRGWFGITDKVNHRNEWWEKFYHLQPLQILSSTISGLIQTELEGDHRALGWPICQACVISPCIVYTV